MAGVSDWREKEGCGSERFVRGKGEKTVTSDF